MAAPKLNSIQVEAGARLLDETDPGWFARINIETLDLSNAKQCILGQLRGSFRQGVRELSDESLLSHTSWCHSHGFTYRPDFKNPLTDQEWDQVWLQLKQYWIQQINQRLQA